MGRRRTAPFSAVHKSGEDYLEAVLVLNQTKGMVRSADMADFMHYSRPSICNGVAALCQAGYLEMDKEHYIHLTEQGREIAEAIYERHRFFTGLLEFAGVDGETAEKDACRLEHDISPEAFDQLKKAFSHHMEI